MTYDEKRAFITELCNNTRDAIMANADRMPDSWDGIELREYIAERFRENAYGFNRRGRRWNDYRNTTLIAGL